MGLYEDRIFPVIMERALTGIKEDRRAVIAQATGYTLELGMGSGANLPYYTRAVSRVVGLEPCAAVVATARDRLRRLDADGMLQIDADSFEFHVGSGERLPFGDQSFDTVIAFLVFCTIPDAQAAAEEAYRVLKPGGKLLFFEHVRSPDRWVGRLQQWVDPLWKVFACGCHLTRDAEAIFREAGFSFQTIARLRNSRMSPPFAAWMIQGQAVRGNSRVSPLRVDILPDEHPAGQSPPGGTVPTANSAGQA